VVLVFVAMHYRANYTHCTRRHKMTDLEKWYEERIRDEHSDMYRQSKACIKEAYEAGCRAGMEEAVEIVNNFQVGRYRENEYEFDLMTERISAAIMEKIHK
jgi:hypothetical protein